MKKFITLFLAVLLAVTPLFAVGTSAFYCKDTKDCNPCQLTVDWYNGEEKLTETQSVCFGGIGKYDTAKDGVPEKAADESYTYEFIGFNVNPNACVALPLVKLADGTVYCTSPVYKSVKMYAIFKAVEIEEPEQEEPEQEEPTPYCPTPAPTPTPACTLHTVTWKNYDETVLHTDLKQIVNGGCAHYVLAHCGVPYKPADEKFYYVFVGWNTDKNAQYPMTMVFDGLKYTTSHIWEDTTYYAIFVAKPKCQCPEKETPKCELYSVNWLNYDGTVLHTDSNQIVKGGTAWYVVAQNGMPTREADENYRYVFIGWNTDPNATTALPLIFNGFMFFSQPICKDTTYYAIYKKIPVCHPVEPVDPEEPEEKDFYSVHWLNYDGTLLHDDPNEIPEGMWAYYILSMNGTPEKPEDDKYTYEFIGWNTDKDATEALDLPFNGYMYFSLPIYEDTTYYAIFKAVEKEIPDEPNYYTVRWLNYDETVLDEADDSIFEGACAEYDTTRTGTPVKPEDENYTYEFLGWNTDKNATEPIAMFFNGTVFTTEPIYEDVTYYAIYQAVKKEVPPTPVVYYTVTWVNGETTIYNETLAEGTQPVYYENEYGVPQKAADKKYTYEFIGWNTDKNATVAGEVTPLTADTTYYAIYKATEIPPVIYTVTWMNETVKIYDEKYEEGKLPTYSVNTYGIPEKAEDEDYTYEFIGWNTNPDANEAIELTPVTGDTTYYAIFKATEKTKIYKVTWMNGDKEIYNEDVEEGTVAQYNEETYKTPEKAATKEYTYKFIGWNTDPEAKDVIELGAIYEDTTYYAIFEEKEITYVITWDVDGKITEEEYKYGETPKYKGEDDRIIGWNPEIVPVTENATYVAKLRVEKTAPKTGDVIKVAVPVALMLLSAAGMAIALVTKKRKEND